MRGLVLVELDVVVDDYDHCVDSQLQDDDDRQNHNRGRQQYLIVVVVVARLRLRCVEQQRRGTDLYAYTRRLRPFRSVDFYDFYDDSYCYFYHFYSGEEQRRHQMRNGYYSR